MTNTWSYICVYIYIYIYIWSGQCLGQLSGVLEREKLEDQGKGGLKERHLVVVTYVEIFVSQGNATRDQGLLNRNNQADIMTETSDDYNCHSLSLATLVPAQWTYERRGYLEIDKGCACGPKYELPFTKD